MKGLKKTIFTINRIIKKVISLDSYNINVANKEEILNLAPVCTLDKNPDQKDRYIKYEQEILTAIEQSSIRNIAISGPYGSGKSSILNTYINRKRKINDHISVSLSSINYEEYLNKDKHEFRAEIERNILKQIIYSVDQDKIPGSKFTRIQSVTLNEFEKKILLFIILIFISVQIFSPSWLDPIFSFINVENIDWLKASNWKIPFLEAMYNNIQKPTIKFFALIGIFLIGFKAYTPTLWRYFYSGSKSLKIKSGVAELSTSESISYLSQNIGEILYFFEMNKNIDLVIFEDLDRLNDEQIFVSLREINEIINKYENIKRDIIFISAIRDNIFSNSYTRVKYFDYIIPVVPFIDYSNSYEILIKYLNDDQAIEKNIQIIKKISYFINDARLLINIVNEYNLYKLQHLGDSSPIELIKLLGIITYKNLYPSDFSDLQQGRGNIHSLIQSLNKKFRRQKSSEIQKNIDNFQIELESTQKENIRSEIELRQLYFLQYIKRAGTVSLSPTQNNSRDFNIETIGDEKVFDHLSSLSSLYNQNNNHIRINFEEIENLVDSENTYSNRLNFIRNKSYKNQYKIKSKIRRLEKEIVEISNKPIHYFMSEVDPNDWVSDSNKATNYSEKFRTQEQFEYASFLINNNLIDTHYHIYISSFHSGTMTTIDRNFMRTLAAEIKVYPDESIDNPELIIEEATEVDFQKEQILNYELINHLSTYRFKYLSKAKSLISQLKSHSEQIEEFISGFFTHISDPSNFIMLLSENWPEFWLYCTENFNTQIQDLILGNLLAFSNKDQLLNFNINDVLKDSINSLQYLPPGEIPLPIQKLKLILTTLEIKFSCVKNLKTNSEYLNLIHEGNNYEINAHMCFEILKGLSGINYEKLKHRLEHSFFTTIAEDFNEYSFKKYIDENLLNFIQNVYFRFENNQRESEIISLTLLNNDNLNEIKIELIKKLDCKIQELTDIKDKSLWPAIFDSNLITSNWSNIANMYYESSNTLVPPILTFITNIENLEQLENNAESVIINESIRQALFIDLISSDKINDDTFLKIVAHIPYYYVSDTINIESISNVKVKSLIKNNTIRVSEDIINSLDKRKDDSLILLLEYQIEELLKQIDKIYINDETYNTLIKSGNITPQQKERLVDSISQTDNENLLSTLKRFFIDNSYQIINSQIVVSLIDRSDINTDSKVKIINLGLLNLNQDNISYCLTRLGGKFKEIGLPNHKPRIKKSSENLTLAKNLKEMKYISSFTENFSNITFSSYKDGPHH